MDKVDRIAVRPMSVAESEPPKWGREVTKMVSLGGGGGLEDEYLIHRLNLFNFDAEVDNICAAPHLHSAAFFGFRQGSPHVQLPP